MLKDENSAIGAPAVMKMRGEETDRLVFNYIKNNSDCTIKEIAEALDMSNGRVDHSVNRLHEQNKVKVQFFRRNRGLVKKVSTSRMLLNPNFDEIRFSLYNLTQKSWNKEAFICAASRSAILVSPKIKESWKEDCILIDQVKINKKSNELFFKLPEKFTNFYEIENSEIDISGYDEELLITVGSTVIPVDIPYDTQYEFGLDYSRARITIDFERVLFWGNNAPKTNQSSYGDSLALSMKDLVNGAKVKYIETEEEYDS